MHDTRHEFRATSGQLPAAPAGVPRRDLVIDRQLPVIKKIIQDETWLEGERRGGPVPPDDRVVRARVCEIVLRIGQQLRDSFNAAIAAESGEGRMAHVRVDTMRRDGS